MERPSWQPESDLKTTSASAITDANHKHTCQIVLRTAMKLEIDGPPKARRLLRSELMTKPKYDPLAGKRQL
jgi:hypothetical protein